MMSSERCIYGKFVERVPRFSRANALSTMRYIFQLGVRRVRTHLDSREKQDQNAKFQKYLLIYIVQTSNYLFVPVPSRDNVRSAWSEVTWGKSRIVKIIMIRKKSKIRRISLNECPFAPV